MSHPLHLISTNEYWPVLGNSCPWLGPLCPICHTKTEQGQQDYLISFYTFFFFFKALHK